MKALIKLRTISKKQLGNLRASKSSWNKRRFEYFFFWYGVVACLFLIAYSLRLCPPEMLFGVEKMPREIFWRLLIPWGMLLGCVLTMRLALAGPKPSSPDYSALKEKKLKMRHPSRNDLTERSQKIADKVRRQYAFRLRIRSCLVFGLSMILVVLCFSTSWYLPWIEHDGIASILFIFAPICLVLSFLPFFKDARSYRIASNGGNKNSEETYRQKIIKS